mgnify:CR=1 FL=1
MKRYEFLARKENETTTIHNTTFNHVEHHIKVWELRKQGYTVREIITEE